MTAKYLKQIGKLKLIHWLQRNYPFQIVELIPVLKGEIGDNYIIITSDNQKYFLKIYLRSKLHIDNPKGLEGTLSLASRLYERGISSIPYPIQASNGNLEIKYGKYAIIVTNFIEGKNPKFSPAITKKFAQLIAKIHQVDVRNINLPVEPFDTSYANKLREQIKTLEEKRRLNKQMAKLKGLLLPRKNLLLNQLKKLDGFCNKSKNKKKKLVITHGDLILDNLLIDRKKNIFIVDWDTARLAPVERDVWFFTGTYGATFLQSYKKFNPPIKIDIDLISFYMYKRYIEDMVYWADQILLGEVDSKQAESNLEGIKICCLEAYKKIEQKLANINKLI